MTEYERGFIDGIKSKVSAELTPTLINVSKTMLEMLKPVLSTALENALNDNNAITDTDVQPVNHWISVKDRLPENDNDVLVYDTDCGIVIGWYDKEIGDFAADFISPLDAVTHWIPLPEPPKEGDT